MSSNIKRTIFTVILMFLAFQLVLAGAAYAQNDIPVAAESASFPLVWFLAPLGSAIALLFAYIFYKSMMASPEGDEKMKSIARHVKDGAYAYLRQQYKVVTIFFIIAVILLIVISFGLGAQSRLVPFAFLTGGFFSGLAGFLGMKTATSASSRTTQAVKESLNKGLRIAFRSGAVMGLVVVGLGLLDICMWFGILYTVWHPADMNEFERLSQITVIMLCFGFGASTQALFARVGGGIFTKAADVGADLVGKVEAGIPEDDPRNPATIADNVGDNVGDVAGMGADLYESYCGSILASAALGMAALGSESLDMGLKGLILPMVIAGVGIIASIIGVYVVRTSEEASQRRLLWALGLGVLLSSIIVLVASISLVGLLIPGHFGIAWAIIIGLIVGLVIGFSILYYTSEEFKPTREIAAQASTGAATVIIRGTAEGMVSTWIPILSVVIGTLLSFSLAGGFENAALGLYGVGIAAVGMLSTLGITLATDAYGPIADNAGGNAEMSGQEPYVRERTNALDSLGNTTAATGKGFAIGSAALTALALLAAYVEEVRVGVVRAADTYVEEHQTDFGSLQNNLDPNSNKVIFTGNGVFVKLERTPEKVVAGETVIDVSGFVRKKLGAKLKEGTLISSGEIEQFIEDEYLKPVAKLTMSDFMSFYKVNLMNPKVLAGLFLGSMLAFVFCALTMKAVGRAASRMVEEVRRQFREIKGIMEGETEPDYASCVEISTRGAQREMILPSLLALIIPMVTGIVLGVAGVMGLLAGGLVCGFSLAIMMANAGGAWDNAKKYIEKGELGGKGSDAHKASVVGDTVGDPFKDTSGPSLNILIKLMSMVSVVFAGMTVKFSPIIADLLNLHVK